MGVIFLTLVGTAIFVDVAFNDGNAISSIVRAIRGKR